MIAETWTDIVSSWSSENNPSGGVLNLFQISSQKALINQREESCNNQDMTVIEQRKQSYNNQDKTEIDQ